MLSQRDLLARQGRIKASPPLFCGNQIVVPKYIGIRSFADDMSSSFWESRFRTLLIPPFSFGLRRVLQLRSIRREHPRKRARAPWKCRVEGASSWPRERWSRLVGETRRGAKRVVYDLWMVIRTADRGDRMWTKTRQGHIPSRKNGNM